MPAYDLGLADRLLLIAVFMVVTVVVQLLPGAVPEQSGWPYVGLLGPVSGLVPCELVQRRSAAKTQESVVAAP